MDNNNYYLKRGIIFCIVLCIFVLSLSFDVKADVNRNFSIRIETDKEEYEINEKVIYKITVQNISQQDVNDIVIEDELPKSIIILESDGEINGQKVTWNKENFIKGEKITLTLSVKVKNELINQDIESDSSNNNIQIKPNNPNTTIPQTGGRNSIGFIIIATIIIFIGYLLFKIKDKKRNTILLLVFVFTSSMIIVNIETVQAESLNIEEGYTHIVKIGDNAITSTITIKGTINLDEEIKDNIAPVINISNPSEDGSTVYEKNVIIQGTSNDNIKVKSVKYSVNDSDLILANGISEWATNNIELELGENKIKIVCEDINGNITKKIIKIILEKYEMYYKEIEENYVKTNEELGIEYVNRQLLISVVDGYNKLDVSELISKYNAYVVGYIDVTNDYQIEFNEEKSFEELIELIDLLRLEKVIESCYFNEVLEIKDNNICNEVEKVENLYNQWGVKVIEADKVWEKYSDEIKSINIGIIDTLFDINHEDLNFVDVWNNREDVVVDKHGTHVSGIFNAKYDNGIGINGIYPMENVLYGYSMKGIATDEILMKISNSLMEYKYALARLICNNVKVINVSLGFESDRNYEFYEELGNYLKKFIYKGYDFVIVQSAGNDSTITPDGEKLVIDSERRGVFSGIKDGEIKDRIIVVGSFGKNENEYDISYFSNQGDRLDIIAPGEKIYSTVPGNMYMEMSGTSMATPHVAGVAAMIWSIDSKLTGSEVKDIIINSAVESKVDGKAYKVLNALNAVKELKKNNNNSEEESNGVILGNIINKHGKNAIEHANIYVYEDNNDENNTLIYSEKTNNQGRFELILSPGKYLIEIYKDGFLGKILKNIEVKEKEVIYFNDIKLEVDLSKFNIIIKDKADFNNDGVDDIIKIYGKDDVGLFKKGEYLVISNGLTDEELHIVYMGGITGLYNVFKNIVDFTGDNIKDINIEYSGGGNSVNYSLLYVFENDTYKLVEDDYTTEYAIDLSDDFEISIENKYINIKRYTKLPQGVVDEFINKGYYTSEGVILNKEEALKEIYFSESKGYDISEKKIISSQKRISYKYNANSIINIEIDHEYVNGKLIVKDFRIK